MSPTSVELRTVVVEREMPFAPERVWRALIQPQLMAEWLMPSDFEPAVDHRFSFRADWGSVDCQVLAIEPMRSLTYSWEARGLESVVTWTLTPTATGTRLRMEQTGFRRDQDQAFHGARMGWTRFLASLETVLARAR